MENCLECGEKLLGRADKKFCNDGCRNAYNNKNNSSSLMMRKVNYKLRKNYKILQNLNNLPEGKIKTTKSKLLNLEFDFVYFTNIRIYKNGSEYRFIYDYGYRFLDDEWILIVKKNP